MGFLSNLLGTSTPPKKLNTSVDITGIELSQEQKALFDKIEGGKENIFITGKAGTGKSVLLQYFRQHTKKQAVVCAFTGVAALNVGGQTINSLFKIAPGFIHLDRLDLDQRTATLLRHVDIVVIDEVSMVRADMMDAIDVLLRQARGNDEPFGGVQIVMFGDLYQLAPIVGDRELHKYFADHHGGFYFFNAHVWKGANLSIYELTDIFRQKDKDFRDVLNSIRRGEVSDTVLTSLNSRAIASIPDDGVITLATTNAIVDRINYRRLAQIKEEPFEYHAEISGEMESSWFPADEVLNLKKGAQVMMLKNDPEKRWVNGTIATIESLDNSQITVNIDGLTYPVSRYSWNKIRYKYNRDTRRIEEEVISSFTQFPLRLAWAITIHKSQGKTYNAVAIDMGGGAFTHGQTYVALSRCTTLEGLYLKQKLRREDVIVDSAVVNFMSRATMATYGEVDVVGA